MAILKNTIINGVLRTNKLWISDQNAQDINIQQSKLILADESGNIIPAKFIADSKKVLSQSGTWIDLPVIPPKYSLPIATKEALGGVSLYNDAELPFGDKVYPVQLNNLHQMLVKVPWTDTNTWLPNTKDQDGYVTKGSGHANKVWKTDSSGIPGWRDDSDTNTTYSKATSSSLGLVRIGYSENGKNYPVELNSDGQMFVNVPWTDNNTIYGVASSSSLGLVKIGYSENDKNYPVKLNNENKMYVTVPWTDNNTTYSVATTSTLGLVKLGLDEKLADITNANPIQLNSNNQMYVEWTNIQNWVTNKKYLTEISDFSTPTYKIHFDYSGSNLQSNQWIAGFERNGNDVYLRVTPSSGLPLTTATTNELKKYVTTSTEQSISGTKTFTASNTTVKTLKSDQVDIKESVSMQYDNTKKCLKFVFV